MTRPGAILANRYLLEEALGRGASGSVFRAKDNALGIPVVIKVLHEGLAQAHDVLERFKRELILARRVTHPGLCKVFDMQSEGDTHFLVMEFIAGETLTNLLKREGKLTPARACDVIRQAASAMGAAHREGIVHRDLKPENIMMRPDGRVAVLDFGIATQEGLDRLTRPGFVLGSRKYMAPELWLGHPPTPQSDVWSLGVILFGALCGRLPYRADGPFGVLDAIKTEQRPLPSSMNPAVLPSLEAVIDRALSVEAGDRYPDAAAFERALEEELRNLSEPTKVTQMPFGLDPAQASPSKLPGATDRPLAIEFPKTDAGVHDAAGPEPASQADDHDDEGRGRTHTNVDAPNRTWEAWAADAPASAAGGAQGVSASAIGAAFDAAIGNAEYPPPQDTKITPADAWRRADAALSKGEVPSGFDASAEKTLIGKAPLADDAPQSFLSSPDETLEGDPNTDLTEDLGRARVRRDDIPTMYVRTAPEDPLVEQAPTQGSRKMLAAALGICVLLVAALVVVFSRDDKSDTKPAEIVASGPAQTNPLPPVEVPPVEPHDVQPDPAGEGPSKVEPPPKPDDKLTVAVKDPPADAPTDEKRSADGGSTPTSDVDTPENPVAAATADDEWEFDDDHDGAEPDKEPIVNERPQGPPSADDARERARLKKLAESVTKAMSAKGLLRGDVRSLDAEMTKARTAIRAKKWASADAHFTRALSIVESTSIDATLVGQKLERFNKRYDKVNDDARRSELGKLAVEIGRAMSKSDHTTANMKLNQALSIAR